MKFSEEQNYKVKLHHRDLGDLGDAQLRYGGEWGVIASMGLLSAAPRLDSNHPLDFVSATLWVRLAGMQRYEGFWDFRLLGYVGLLDRCVAQRTQARPGGSSSPPHKVKKLAAALCRLTPALDTPVVREIVRSRTEYLATATHPTLVTTWSQG